ncbi:MULTISPECIES: type II glyceraldehyde-3-phosphate dehydrogenase [unclassified Halomonas]|uniref:type II glyceraldehyde-3-phosphate dehydrogenase n=1 Tax=unclassified Halomonas TaxID=2609666 RepID=UPI0005FCC588|nr:MULTISPECIES: type II glyceraldehyde-3-phosphate dehydrogenase [unclassified Halomonas]CEP35296.1 Putative uncharacterized protein [Halomonas sp. R57-5]
MNRHNSLSISKPRIALLGMGTIGKRLAETVKGIPEFELTGVGVRRLTPALIPIIQAGIPVYCTDSNDNTSLEGVVAGDAADLLSSSDYVLDCTPRGTGAVYSNVYNNYNLRMIYQGGESSALAACNYCYGHGYNEAISAPSVRILSCNTTGLVRIIHSLSSSFTVQSVRAVLTRSAADPDKSLKGYVNNILPSMGVSHHSSDAKLFWPDLEVHTQATYAPVNCGHLISMFANLKGIHSRYEILDVLRSSPRIKVIEGRGGLTDLRDVGRGHKRNDCPDLIIWQESVQTFGENVVLSAGVHMESIVIPETLDALFAMTRLELDVNKAMGRSDQAIL